MELERAAPVAGILGCLAAALTFVAPYVAASGWGAELGRYYAAGPVGVTAVVFLALLGVVVFLAAFRGRTDPDVAAGIALVLGVTMVAIAVSWALVVPLDVVYGYPGSWITDHRWYLVASTAVVSVAAAAYARAVV
ncbi:MAG: hypothetical protein ABEJ78_10565 [Haloferacaceae archaeon]